MSQKHEDIFIEIRDPAEKEKILSDVARQSIEIKIKNPEPDSHVCSVSPRTLNELALYCKVLLESFTAKFAPEVIVQFDYYDQKYVGQVPARTDSGFVTLEFSRPLFRVQRREDFRVKIPTDAKGSIQFPLGGVTQTGNLIDLSAGGCCVGAQKDLNWVRDQVLNITLRLKAQRDLEMEVRVCHVEADSLDTKKVKVGMQFLNISEVAKNRMAGLTMDLYREYFKNRQ